MIVPYVMQFSACMFTSFIIAVSDYLLCTPDADFTENTESYQLGPTPGGVFSSINIVRDEIIEEEEGFIARVDVLAVPPNTIVQFGNRTTLIRIAAGEHSNLCDYYL